MDRRQFFKVSAATGASATLAGCGNPENQLIRFIPEDTLIPGIAVWRPSVCPLCSSGCGLTVRVMQDDAEVERDGQTGVVSRALAKKLEGNPDHPINQGKLCVRGQAAIQATYHPDRIRQPLRLTGARGSGQFQPISWEEGLAELTGRLDALAAAGAPERLAFLTRPLTGQRDSLIRQFLTAFGAPAPVVFDVFDQRVLRRANALSFGFEQLPTIDLAESRYLLAFGADLLGTWNSPVAQNVGYGQMRQGRPGMRGKFVHVERRMSQTGANADEWVPALPGTEGVLALGLAHVILRDGLFPVSNGGRAGALIGGWSDGLPDYTPEAVQEITGVDAARVERLAREFAENAPAVAVVGGAPLAHTNGMFHALAVNALNALVGSVGRPGGMLFTPASDGSPRAFAAGRTIDEMTGGVLNGASPVEVLLLNEANPVFGAPPAARVREALDGIGFIVSFGQFIDETSNLADLILPDHSFLESWVDSEPESGSSQAVLGLAPPTMRPIHQTRATGDVLLEVGRSLAQPLNLPWESYEGMLQARFEALPPLEEGEADPWQAVQTRGGWWRPAPLIAPQGAAPAGQTPAAYDPPQFDGADAHPYHFIPFASPAFLDGSLAHLPWLQELPDPLSTAMWSTWIELNPTTAAELGIEMGDLVEVTSSQGALLAPAVYSPGIAPDAVAMPVGQGHETYTRFASGRGSNPLSILAPLVETATGAPAWAATRVSVRRVEGESGLILFAGALREHEPHPR